MSVFDVATGHGNAAGIAFGVERLVMLLIGTSSISDILPISVRERFIARSDPCLI